MIDFDKPLCIPTIAVKVELVKDRNGQTVTLKLLSSASGGYCAVGARLATIGDTARYVFPNGRLVNEFGNDYPYGGYHFIVNKKEPEKVNNKEVREGKGYFKLKVGKYPYWMECEFKHVIDDLWHVSGGFYTDSFNGIYSSDDFDCRMIK